jgi:HSP20 family protein
MIRFHNHPAMSNVLEGIFNNPVNQGRACGIPANIYEDENAFVIELSAPGYSKENFNISIEEQTLRISSEAKEHEIDDEKFLRREFEMGIINKSFALPKTVDVDNISAQYNNGILSVKLPLLKDAKIKKEIALS